MVNKYEHKRPALQKSYAPSFVDPPRWVICRRTEDGKEWSLQKHEDKKTVLYWNTKEEAEFTLSNMATASAKKRWVRRLYKDELLVLGEDGMSLVTPVKRSVNAKKAETMAKKISSIGNLVDVYEDLENRKFAVASKAATESEFITEVAQAISANHDPSWAVRLRELLPLVVDMCCKYRGYKAELVYERRELVAGDLEIPNREKAS